LKRILVISYYFPPCNLTAAQKAYSWALYLNRFGYYPTIITRNWDKKISSKYDVAKRSGSSIVHEENKNYEVYYLPNKGTLRDYFFLNDKNFGFSMLSRFITFSSKILQNFFNVFILNKNIFNFAQQYLYKNKGINKMVVTGNPFIFFKMGYLLNKQFGIKWIADYRDMWSTQKLHEGKSNPLFKIIDFFDCRFEKKWVKSASYITSVSDHYAKTIGHFVSREYAVVPNGYFEEDFENIAGDKLEDFTLCYSGTLYNSQNISILIQAYKEFINSHNSSIKCKLLFLGAAWNIKQKERIEKLLDGYESYFEITDRVSREKSLEILIKCHMLLLFPYENSTSVIPSKLYEYIALKVPILFTPSDQDIVESLIEQNQLGYICNTIDSTRKVIEKAYQICLQNKNDTLPISSDNQEKFSRRESTRVMAELLNKI
jgi:glycosyltransferase involved in cell wall biosynthesis